MAAHVGDQGEEVRAVDRGVVEAGFRAVTVGVQTSAAAIDYRALPARPAQAGDSLLTGNNAGMLAHQVQGMVKDVHSGLGGAVKGYLQRIDLLIAAVSLNDDKIYRVEPEGLGKTSTAAQSRKDRVKGPYSKWLSFR